MQGLLQYKDKIIEENRDAGVLGAIIGTPVSAVTSIPQLIGMKALTGEMQRPSEAWGFSSNEEDSKVTKYGKVASNFVMDAVADPANLVGAGLLTKERALAGLTASKESGLLSKTYKLNPWAFKPNTETGIDNLGDNLNTINNQLPDPEPFISLDINSSRSFNLSRAKRDSKNIYKETLEEGNLRYEYFTSLEDKNSILLVDTWKDEKSIDLHHKSEMMKVISKLRKKYQLKMKVTKFKEI